METLLCVEKAIYQDRQYQPPRRIAGRLFVQREHAEIHLRFNPTAECAGDELPAEAGSISIYGFDFELLSLKGYTIEKSSNAGNSYIIFHLDDGQKKGPLYFDNPDELQRLIEQLAVHLIVSLADPTLHFYTTKLHDPDALHRSLAELNFFTPQQQQYSKSLLHKLKHDPYSACVSGLGMIAKVASDSLYYTYRGLPQQQHHSRPHLAANREEPLDVTSKTEDGFEVLSRSSSNKQPVATPAPPVRQQSTRPKAERGAEVTKEDFHHHLDPDGRVKAVESLRLKIFKGGVQPHLRKTLWPYMLDYIPWDATQEEINEIKKQRSSEYFRIKGQWMSISEDQESRFGILRERRSLIEKDVNRTDRIQGYFQTAGPGLTLLTEILMTYGMYNFDLGYVQGMSDLLSPLLVVMEDEVDAFWCFVGFVRRLERNFDEDQAGTKVQMSQLHALVSLLQPDLAAYLQQHDSSNMYFCFRWLLVWFKREFHFQEILRMWEVLWSNQPCANFHLICCCAILEAEKHYIMHSRLDFTGILKHINDTAYHIDLQRTLETAESMFMQLTEMEKLPVEVADILGFQDTRPNAEQQSQQQQQQAKIKPGGALRVQ